MRQGIGRPGYKKSGRSRSGHFYAWKLSSRINPSVPLQLSAQDFYSCKREAQEGNGRTAIGNGSTVCRRRRMLFLLSRRHSGL
jgi:hypothetical protein